jgi:5'(3')-deoxyribonucleotidase
MQMSEKRPILLDCDGVVASFVDRVLQIANEKLGTDHKFEDVKGNTQNYDWWKEAGLEEIVHEEGFCSSIPVIPGAQNFVEKLRETDHPIMFVTSPMNGSRYWFWERYLWLSKNFGVKRTELTFATEKRYVNGLVFLDDHVGNVLHWQEYQHRRAVLIARPWNEDIFKDCEIEESSRYYKEEVLKDSANYQMLFHAKKKQTVYRSNDWDAILKLVYTLSGMDAHYNP